MPSRPRKTSRKQETAVRITTAQEAPEEDLDHRQRRYIIAMTVRTLCFLGAVAVGPGWFRWVLLSGAVFLPYIAVVVANATSQRTDTFEVEGVDAAALPPAATAYRIEATGEWRDEPYDAPRSDPYDDNTYGATHDASYDDPRGGGRP